MEVLIVLIVFLSTPLLIFLLVYMYTRSEVKRRIKELDVMKRELGLVRSVVDVVNEDEKSTPKSSDFDNYQPQAYIWSQDDKNW